MNSNLAASEPTIRYYDADYPSRYHSIYPENFDETTVFQGLAHDVERYEEIAAGTGGPILELCAGTGRVAIPLAARGHAVSAVDICEAQLDRLRANEACAAALSCAESEGRSSSIETHVQDVARLQLPRKDFRLAIIAFNSLLCIPDFESQRRTLSSARAHLACGGILCLDVVNPLRIKIDGDSAPKAFYTRRNPGNGNTFTRFAMVDAFDENHRQRLHGWYDEIDAEGRVTRSPYSMHWRPIFRTELELMLAEAGFRLRSLEGGHRKERYSAQSPRMFVTAEAV